jgi:hypothetical protein
MLIFCPTEARFVCLSFMYTSNARLDQRPAACSSSSGRPALANIDAKPMRKESPQNAPRLLSVYGPRSRRMSLFILFLVRGVPLSKTNSGEFWHLGFSLYHAEKALTGQICPSLQNTSTTVGVMTLVSLEHLRQMCIAAAPRVSELTFTSFVKRVKSGSNVDSCFDRSSPIRNAPAIRGWPLPTTAVCLLH